MLYSLSSQLRPYATFFSMMAACGQILFAMRLPAPIYGILPSY
jgi:hypothetical protein